jgi:hypothetical protein
MSIIVPICHEHNSFANVKGNKVYQVQTIEGNECYCSAAQTVVQYLINDTLYTVLRAFENGGIFIVPHLP